MEIIELPEDNSMDILSPKGTKVIFSGNGGWDHDILNARKYLTIGVKYTVLDIRVDDWFSYVVLQEFPHLEFNTVMFDKI